MYKQLKLNRMNNFIKTFVFIGVLSLMLVSCIQTPTKTVETLAEIKGTFKGELKGKEIHLCKVEHGSTTKVATTLAGKHGDFGFSYAIDEPGLYVLNIVWESVQRNVKKDHDLKRFYLEKGTELKIELDEDSYKLLKTNSKKNEVLSEWNNMVDTVFTYSHGFRYNVLSYVDFFPLLSGFVEKARTFKNQVNTDDKNFDELLQLMVDTDMKSAALRMIYTPRTVHPKKEDFPEFYEEILETGAPKSERLLELANGFNFGLTYSMYKAMNTKIDSSNPNARREIQFGAFQNDLLKGYFALDLMKRFRSYDQAYIDFKKRVTPYLKTEYLKNKMEVFEMTIRKFSEGQPAFDFGGKDVNGKISKLSDYEGKLVYVDVWATWCGPCKVQIPALKKLEKKYHGKPITFLSISLDKQKDLNKWKKFVADNELRGVQLIADDAFDSTVAKAYGINGIPRFMLFDKKGNIVSTDAPRPSDKKIEGLLNKNL
jgi:thiol-disulfide isomerase/thioredoxin